MIASRVSFKSRHRSKKREYQGLATSLNLKKNSMSHVYYAQNKESICAYKRARYVLTEPKSGVKETCMKHSRL